MKGLYPTLFDKLEAILGRYEFSQPQDVRMQPMDRNPVPGIKVYDGFYCPAKLEDGRPCPEVCLKTSALYVHITKHQRGDQGQYTKENLSDYPCNCQTLFTSNHRKYFRVKPKADEWLESSVNPWSSFKSGESPFPENTTKFLEPYKEEELPSLLRITQWHNFIHKFRNDPQDVVDLIKHPAKPWEGQGEEQSDSERALKKLSEISNFWMAQISEQWKEAEDYIHRVLHRFPV